MLKIKHNGAVCHQKGDKVHFTGNEKIKHRGWIPSYCTCGFYQKFQPHFTLLNNQEEKLLEPSYFTQLLGTLPEQHQPGNQDAK